MGRSSAGSLARPETQPALAACLALLCAGCYAADDRAASSAVETLPDAGGPADAAPADAAPGPEDAATPDPSPEYLACVDGISRSSADAGPDTGSCQCTACLRELLDCFEDAACVAIFTCAAKVGCSGAGCFSPDRCQAEIRDAGVPSASLDRVTGASECTYRHCVD